MAFEGGYTSAVNSQSTRASEDVRRQALQQQMVQMAIAFQQEQAQNQKRAAMRAKLGEMLPELMGGGQIGPPPGGGPQPPPPGQSSEPMARPAPPAMPGMPPGAIPPPPPAAAPAAAPMPQGAGSGAPMPKSGPPSDVAASGPPPGWQPLPKPPGAAPQAPGAIPPPPEEGAVMPRQTLSVGDMAKLLSAKGIKGEQALAMIEEWKPFMDSQNKTELDALKVKSQAQAAALKAYQQVVRDAETARHHGVLEKQGEKRLGQSQQRINAKANPADTSEGQSARYKTDPEYKKQVDFWAKLVQSGQSLPPRFAQSGAGKKMYGDIIATVPTLGSGNPSDIAAGKLNQREMTAEATKLGTQSASVAIANKELMRFIPLAEKAIDAVPRTGWRPLNQLVQAGENTWSPEQKALVIANRSVQNAFAQLIQRGAPTVHSLSEAEKLLNSADSPAVYKAAMKQLRQEGEQAEEGLKDAHEDLMKRARTTVGSERPGAVKEFANEAEAKAAKLAPGTRVKIGGVTGTWE